VLTINGKPQSYLAALPYLIKVWKREGFFRSLVHPCACDSYDCDSAPDNPLPGGDWGGCPYAVLRQAWCVRLFSLYSMKDIAPLAGWPDSYPAWVASGLVQIHRAVEAG
tara:strand:- start:2622 stop:2948 length:327 start_codon:yes stop_codon:yes gene_type:complete